MRATQKYGVTVYRTGGKVTIVWVIHIYRHLHYVGVVKGVVKLTEVA